jgi:CheY-like chemotaxis protein
MQHTRGLNVLVVAERGGLAEALAPPLLADGHVVGDVVDGLHALAAAQAVFPDVVLLDADLAGLDVPRVTREIGGVSSRRRPFFIALARQVVDECNPTQPIGGIDLYLSKPSAPSKVREVLRRFQEVVTDFDSFDPVI